MSKSQIKSQPKTKIVLSDEESDNKKELDDKKENVEEEFADYLFRFGKYKLMLASQIVSLETVNPKTKDKMKTGVNYLQWCLKTVLAKKAVGSAATTPPNTTDQPANVPERNRTTTAASTVTAS